MSNKSGTSSQIISLPKGGGALQGIGEKFSPDLHTGTGNFTVPITLPPGRNAFQPELSFVYSTGNGNGAFGLGWGLSILGVSRQTSKGVPVYDDSKDTFVLSGAEDLVPVSGGPQGATRYRPRTEGLFARIQHHRDRDGVLRLTDGRLSFTASSAQRAGHGQMTRRQLRALEQEVQRPELAEKMHRGEEVRVFDVPLDLVDEVVFPRFFLGLVLNLQIGGTELRFAFGPPQGLQDSGSGDRHNTKAQLAAPVGSKKASVWPREHALWRRQLPREGRAFQKSLRVPASPTCPPPKTSFVGREHEILTLVAEHRTNPEIAGRLSQKTGRNHVSNLHQAAGGGPRASNNPRPRSRAGPG